MRHVAGLKELKSTSRERRLLSMFFLLVLLTFVAGCKGSRELAPPRAKLVKPIDPWVLTCNDPNAKLPALLWNGLIGIHIGRDGTGTNLSMLDIDDFETKDEEKIVERACILQGSIPFETVRIRNYEQTLDMRTGLLKTTWISDGKQISVETALDPTRRVISQRWSGHFDVWTMADTAWPGGPPLKQKVWGNERTISLGTPSNRNRMLVAMGKAPQKLDSAPDCPRFEDVAKASTKFWQNRWKTDIEIDGPVEDQQAIHSFLFYLRGAIRPGALMALAPFGLSNSKYNGHVFWDDDIWVFPVLAMTDPDLARTIPNYRLAHTAGADGNYLSWIKRAKLTAHDRMRDNLSAPKGGLKFPWESSVTGKESMPGPSQFEDHVTGSVTWGLNNAMALGFIREADYQKVLTGSAAFWQARVSPRKDGLVGIRETISPDENFAGDNDLYTNILAQWTLGQALGSKAPRLSVPSDSKSLISYDGDTFRGYKQPAAILAIYPLQYPRAEKQVEVMMGRFADKTFKYSPAMADSVHALIWARFGEPEKAYPIWQGSWKGFTEHPLMLFSEKKIQNETYFATGAASSLQTVMYGFLGFRIDSVKDPKAAWTKQLNAGRWLSVTPHLPQAWKSVKFKNFTVLGTQYTLTATHRGAQVTPGEK